MLIFTTEGPFLKVQYPYNYSIFVLSAIFLNFSQFSKSKIILYMPIFD